MRILAALIAMSPVLFVLSCAEPDSRSSSIGRVEIHYVPWYMTYTIDLNCDDFVTGEFPAEQISIVDSAELQLWDQTLGTWQPDSLPGYSAGGDCRICCMVYNQRDSLIHEICMWPAGVQVDGKICKANDTLVSLIQPHLPVGYFSGAGDFPALRDHLRSTPESRD